MKLEDIRKKFAPTAQERAIRESGIVFMESFMLHDGTEHIAIAALTGWYKACDGTRYQTLKTRVVEWVGHKYQCAACTDMVTKNET